MEVQGKHFSTMLAKVIDEMSPTDYNQWECVDVTTEAKNMLMRRGGHSANQMVFGRDPEIPGDDLLGDQPNPIANGAILEDAVAEFSHRARMSARRAVLEALDHRAARIALNSRLRPLREFKPGDEVAVWRRGRGIKKNMARWRCPGIVAGETGGNYWVSMPGSFIKCAPEQLRLRTTEEREADRFLVRDLRAAATQLFPEVGASNKTQKNFMDITRDDFPPGECLFINLQMFRIVDQTEMIEVLPQWWNLNPVRHRVKDPQVPDMTPCSPICNPWWIGCRRMNVRDGKNQWSKQTDWMDIIDSNQVNQTPKEVEANHKPLVVKFFLQRCHVLHHYLQHQSMSRW